MSGLTRTWWQYLLRGLLVLALCMVPAIGDRLSMSLIPIALGALLAYEGLDERSISWSVVMLLAIELIWGIGIGVVTLPYLLTVLLMRMVQRFLSVEPLSRSSGWIPLSLIRTAVLAWVFGLTMTLASALVQSMVYGSGDFGALVSSAIHPLGLFLAVTGGGALVLVACLYRIDVPFRASITFGV